MQKEHINKFYVLYIYLFLVYRSNFTYNFLNIEMEEFENTSYFSQLPNEIQIIIFNYLSTADFINVCTAYPVIHDNFSNDKGIVR